MLASMAMHDMLCLVYYEFRFYKTSDLNRRSIISYIEASISLVMNC